jgi:hypothetical protein
MMDFVTTYWLAIAPSFLTGLYLLSVLKRARDQKRRASAVAGAECMIERR